jgi:membrane protein YdbS with pleckstrin-like domain
MPLPVIPLQPLEPGQLHVMRLRSLVFAGILMAPAAIVPFVALPRLFARYGVPLWAPAAVIALFGLYLLMSAGRRWRRWGYAFTGRELHVASGWLVHMHTIVPVSRVQHIDVSQGVLERMFGVSTLSLHTAGTENSVVSLPGVTRDTAEDIRDAIRGEIGSVDA